MPKVFKFVVRNPCLKSSPSLTILVSLWFIISSLVFFYLSKLLFSGFLQVKGNFIRGSYESSTDLSKSEFRFRILLIEEDYREKEEGT